MSPLEIFCRQIRARSDDHRKAFALIYKEKIWSQAIAILRQELDSMMRVIYLLSIKDMSYRNDLITASVEGRKWTAKGTRKRITDREMVELANKLKGWTESVYRFGCGFIHLSSFHDYQDRDPMDMISTDEKNAILHHMRYYHGGPHETDPKMADLYPYLPMVLDKVASNLECYVKELEAKKVDSVRKI
jgi:hypothetical protein